jgi:hypothetical protein
VSGAVSQGQSLGHVREGRLRTRAAPIEGRARVERRQSVVAASADSTVSCTERC